MGTYVLGRARLVTLEGDAVGASFGVLRFPHSTSLHEVGSVVMLLSGLQDAHLALGMGENKLFVVLRKDEAVGCALIVFDVFHQACHGVIMGAEWCKAIL